nr:60S ribosomal protein L38 isoform X2 [Equus asinus]
MMDGTEGSRVSPAGLLRLETTKETLSRPHETPYPVSSGGGFNCPETEVSSFSVLFPCCRLLCRPRRPAPLTVMVSLGRRDLPGRSFPVSYLIASQNRGDQGLLAHGAAEGCQVCQDQEE